MSAFGFAMNAPAPRKRPWWHFALAVVAVVALLGFGMQKLFGGPADFTGDPGPVVTVSIESGDTLRIIGRKLKDAGVVASSDAFVAASEANADARYITPGDYRIATHLPASTAIKVLLSPESRDEVRVTIKEGWRAKLAIKEFADRTGHTFEEIQQAFDATALPPSANGNVEGYLFPATYAVKRTATPADIAKMPIARFYQAATTLELERRARALGLTVREVVIIASLLEGEGAPADYAKIARVIFNRLQIKMPLQLDSTVNYGLGKTSLQLSSAELKRDTPYNTYLRIGLPPTAIGNPGEAALEAVLSPAAGNWLYFVTTDPEKRITEFAVTYEDFLRLKAKFKRNA